MGLMQSDKNYIIKVFKHRLEYMIPLSVKDVMEIDHMRHMCFKMHIDTTFIDKFEKAHGLLTRNVTQIGRRKKRV